MCFGVASLFFCKYFAFAKARPLVWHIGGIMLDFVSTWPVAAQIAAYVVGLGLGVFCLVKFCNYFVDASSTIAQKLKISPLIIGLTIVAMGTSLPELAVSASDSISVLVSAEGARANVAIGNVIGSNICNLLLVLGTSVLFTPIVVKKSVSKREFPILLSVSALMVLFVFLFGDTAIGSVVFTRLECVVFVVGIVAYLAYLVVSAKKDPVSVEVEMNEIADMSWPKAIFLVIIGAAGTILGGVLVVFGAKGLSLQGAQAAGLNHDLAETLVGLTVVAVGTSLPELVTSCIAAKKGQNEIALGNVIGSNIFNSLFVLGIAGVINPLSGGSEVLVDVVVMFAITLLVFLFSLNGKFERKEGIVLLGCYVVYVVYLVLRTLHPEWFGMGAV